MHEIDLAAFLAIGLDLDLDYIALGEKDLAFKWLDRAYEAHDPFLDALKTDVRYKPIRSDPRYAVLLKKMGFEK